MSFRTCLLAIAVACMSWACAVAQAPFSPAGFNGLDMNLGNLYRLSDAKTLDQSEPHAKFPPLPNVEQLRIKPIQVAAPK